MSKVILKVEIEEDYLKSIKASTNKTSSDIILINATPLTESDDAVSRHAVIEHSYDRYDYTTDKPIEVVNVNEIKELPSVIPTRERGELIYIGESDFAKIYECSVCNTRISGIYGRPNFCPYCGVDMRGD